jgi:hypothetical protein
LVRTTSSPTGAGVRVVDGGAVGDSRSSVYFGLNGVYPSANLTLVDNSRDLGTASWRWKDLYLSGAAYASTYRKDGDSDTYLNFPAANQLSLVGGGATLFKAYQIAGAYGVLEAHGSGSATYPNYTFNGDTNTGMYRATTDTLAFTTGGSERMRIASNGAITVSSNAFFLLDATTGLRFNDSTDSFNNVIMADNGNVTIRGALSKGSGSFRIDHPLESKKDTHELVHSFVEAPQADNIYRGKVDLVDGSATVNIDTVAGMTEGTFVALNREVQCFTSNESNWDAVKGSVLGNILTIECQNTSSTATVSWLVIGERQDQHMYDTDWTDDNGKVIVEPLKGE